MRALFPLAVIWIVWSAHWLWWVVLGVAWLSWIMLCVRQATGGWAAVDRDGWEIQVFRRTRAPWSEVQRIVYSLRGVPWIDVAGRRRRQMWFAVPLDERAEWMREVQDRAAEAGVPVVRKGPPDRWPDWVRTCKVLRSPLGRRTR